MTKLGQEGERVSLDSPVNLVLLYLVNETFQFFNSSTEFVFITTLNNKQQYEKDIIKQKVCTLFV